MVNWIFLSGELIRPFNCWLLKSKAAIELLARLSPSVCQHMPTSEYLVSKNCHHRRGLNHIGPPTSCNCQSIIILQVCPSNHSFHCIHTVNVLSICVITFVSRHNYSLQLTDKQIFYQIKQQLTA